MASPKARGRMLRRTISESQGFASLSPEAAVLFVMLIPHFNAHGKMAAGPGVIKDEVVVLIPYLTYDNLPVYLQEISDKTNVKWFREGNKWWLHSLHFLDEHQDLELGKLGKDLLPSYTPADSLRLVGDYSETTPRLVADSPLRAEGFKVLKEEPTKVKTQQHAGARATSAADGFERCFDKHETRLRELFPLVDFPFERELCIAHYRDGPPKADPYPLVLKWFDRIPKGGRNGSGVAGRSKAFGGKAQGVTPPNGPDTDFLAGSQFAPSGSG